eukprot:TRINITY_DN432_c0_g1_i2.p1 TRINITY_DN432_c0_g1~~TRINITY_DN432_c0_g1_i2.p1  ORF type:complete len:122 (+),score=24.73 TRINITY_DN432_c0_g1_i2:96-461(+)
MSSNDAELHLEDGVLKKWIFCGPLTCPRGKAFYALPSTTIEEIVSNYETKNGLPSSEGAENSTKRLMWFSNDPKQFNGRQTIQLWPLNETNRHVTVAELGIWEKPSASLYMIWDFGKKDEK